MRRPERAGHPMASEILLASHVPGLTPDALALAGPACLPPPRSDDCAAKIPSVRRSAALYVLAGGRRPLRFASSPSARDRARLDGPSCFPLCDGEAMTSLMTSCNGPKPLI